MRAIDSTSSDRSAGFTLIELAVAVFIIALLLGSILVPLQTQVESRKYDETTRILDQARDALLGYAAANGYFPCPADYAGVSAGQEAVTSTSHNSGGTCGMAGGSVTGLGATGVYIGFLPAVTLGLTPTDAQGYLVDAWGLPQNRIRYAVSAQNVNSANNCTTNSVTRPFISTNGMRNATMQCVMNSTLLSVCSTATGATTTACANAASTLVSNAIVVLWSLGPNAATGGGTSAQEVKNAQSLAGADRVFVMRTKSDVAGQQFDDVVTWIAPPMILNRLIAAGQLP